MATRHLIRAAFGLAAALLAFAPPDQMMAVAKQSIDSGVIVAPVGSPAPDTVQRFAAEAGAPVLGATFVHRCHPCGVGGQAPVAAPPPHAPSGPWSAAMAGHARPAPGPERRYFGGAQGR
jgi:hypothetical protein